MRLSNPVKRSRNAGGKLTYGVKITYFPIQLRPSKGLRMKSSKKADPTFDERCGSTSGYKAHWRRKENACQPCKDSMTKYSKKYDKKQYLREYYELNKEHHKERYKIYYESIYGEKARAISKQWRLDNPEKARLNNLMKEQRRRAAKASVESDFFTYEDVLNLYGNTCHICNLKIDLSANRKVGLDGWENGLHLDHLMPLARGGSHTLKNIRPSHGYCNIKKGVN